MICPSVCGRRCGLRTAHAAGLRRSVSARGLGLTLGLDIAVAAGDGRSEICADVIVATDGCDADRGARGAAAAALQPTAATTATATRVANTFLRCGTVSGLLALVMREARRDHRPSEGGRR